MAKLFVFFIICLTSVYSEPIMLKTLNMNKEMMPEKMDDPVMVETAMAKPKRDSYPYHLSTPCPPYLHSHISKGWHPPQPHVQFIHQPTVIQKPVVVKPHVPYHQPGWNSGWNQGWNSNPGWNSGWQNPGWNSGWQSKPQGWNSGWQNPGWNSGWQSKPQGWNSGWSNPYGSGWNKPSHGWQQPIVISKPSWPSSYAPQYHKPAWQVPSYHSNLIKPAVVVKPDCPPWQQPHSPHSHTGVVYAPQHQSYHEPHIKYLHQEPQYVKVVKPVHHQPSWQPQPWHPQPQPWQPPVHHIPKVEICD